MIPLVKVRDPETYAIIGAAMEVHREMGHGFLEAAYHEALAYEFGQRNISFTSEIELSIFYKGIALPCKYRAEFVCFGNIIVEVKAIKQLSPVDRAQTINYLKATRFARGLLFNFGDESLEYERLVGPQSVKSV